MPRSETHQVHTHSVTWGGLRVRQEDCREWETSHSRHSSGPPTLSRAPQSIAGKISHSKANLTAGYPGAASDHSPLRGEQREQKKTSHTSLGFASLHQQPSWELGGKRKRGLLAMKGIYTSMALSPNEPIKQKEMVLNWKKLLHLNLFLFILWVPHIPVMDCYF